jgi:hypothetical protein
VVDVDAGVDLGAGVPPRGDMVAGGHDEGAQAEFALRHGVFLTVGYAKSA